MKIAVLHGEVALEAAPDELDVLIQAEAVSEALLELGHEPTAVSFSFNLERIMEALRTIQPNLVFNLVESVAGQGSFIHMAPVILDYLKLPYTGSGTEALLLTSNKLVAKSLLQASGLPTPAWFPHDGTWDGRGAVANLFIVKSVWEHASIGLDENSVVYIEDAYELGRQMDRRQDELGGDCFAEAYVEGREFNLSLLASPSGLEVLPPAEIRFISYPPGKPKIVDYNAKWGSESFAYHHTPRTFDFGDEDQPLLGRLTATAKKCWDLFRLRGYARVDFRVDAHGKPWVLEVNANPCLSPDSGFVASAQRASLSFGQVIERIIQDSIVLSESSADEQF